MLDIKLIREEPDLVRKALSDRQMQSDVVNTIVDLDNRRREILSEVETLKAERNVVSPTVFLTVFGIG